MLTALLTDRKVEGENCDDDRARRDTGLARISIRNRTHSLSDDTLTDISRPHTGFSEIVEELVNDFIPGSIWYLILSLDLLILPFSHFRTSEPPQNNELATDIGYVSDLLSRFVCLMARIQTLSNDSVATTAPGHQSEIQESIVEWSTRAQQWFGQFVEVLQKASEFHLM